MAAVEEPNGEMGGERRLADASLGVGHHDHDFAGTVDPSRPTSQAVKYGVGMLAGHRYHAGMAGLARWVDRSIVRLIRFMVGPKFRAQTSKDDRGEVKSDQHSTGARKRKRLPPFAPG